MKAKRKFVGTQTETIKHFIISPHETNVTELLESCYALSVQYKEMVTPIFENEAQRDAFHTELPKATNNGTKMPGKDFSALIGEARKDIYDYLFDISSPERPLQKVTAQPNHTNIVHIEGHGVQDDPTVSYAEGTGGASPTRVGVEDIAYTFADLVEDESAEIDLLQCLGANKDAIEINDTEAQKMLKNETYFNLDTNSHAALFTKALLEIRPEMRHKITAYRGKVAAWARNAYTDRLNNIRSSEEIATMRHSAGKYPRQAYSKEHYGIIYYPK